MNQPAEVLLVTGASRGIGAATALLAGQRGYRVCINYRDSEAAARNVVQKIHDCGGIAVAIQADVTIESEVVRLFEETDRALGKLTALVNNVGIIGGERRVDEADASTLQQLWNVNITSFFTCARQAVRRMSRLYGGLGGAIVNVSSMAGKLGGRPGRVHYGASKGAIDAFTRGLAKEVASEGIRVNAVAPGLTDTEIHDAYGGAERIKRLATAIPLQRAGTPAEVANAILWLLSRDASYVTGTILEVAGGV